VVGGISSAELRTYGGNGTAGMEVASAHSPEIRVARTNGFDQTCVDRRVAIENAA